jgi:hypothetical protein
MMALTAAAIKVTDAPSWFEHVDLMQVIIVALLLVCMWFFKRTLAKIDANQALLFDKLNAQSDRLSHLEGEHKARCERGEPCAAKGAPR